MKLSPRDRLGLAGACLFGAGVWGAWGHVWAYMFWGALLMALAVILARRGGA